MGQQVHQQQLNQLKLSSHQVCILTMSNLFTTTLKSLLYYYMTDMKTSLSVLVHFCTAKNFQVPNNTAILKFLVLTSVDDCL